MLFPILMYTKVYRVSALKRVGLHTLNAVMGLVALLAVVGSFRGIILNASTFDLFARR